MRTEVGGDDPLRRRHIAAVAEAAEKHRAVNPEVGAVLEQAAADLTAIADCLAGRASARSVRAAVGRVGELVLIARALAEGETPIATGARGGSDFIAVSPEGQLVASEAKASLAAAVLKLPPVLDLRRQGQAWAIDPADGTRTRARQGTIPYAGRDAARLDIPIDAAENLPYRFLFVALRAEGVWGSSEWYSLDIRRDPSRTTLYCHDEPEPVARSVGFEDDTLTGLLAAAEGALTRVMAE